MTDEKVLENRLRRIAERRGWRLEKSRRRDPNAVDFGGYMLVDDMKNAVIAGGDPFAYSLDLSQVEDWLATTSKSGALKPKKTSA